MRKFLTIAIIIEWGKKIKKINFSSQNFNVVLECNFYEYDTSFSILCRKSTTGNRYYNFYPFVSFDNSWNNNGHTELDY